MTEIASGSRLGPYEVLSPIGAGGMGEVWRGRDTRLDRSIAIKLLPAELAANANLRLRFEREARAISQLSHPHICTLFDIGHEDGRDFLVMELLDGESLATRLARGPLPMHEVLRYGMQIADALDKAHRRRIVHRDLKPGNVMLTKSGAKLLDFGLATIANPGEAGGSGIFASQTHHPTIETLHKPLTEEGTILGTFQYMAPEQLEGVEADARTDIFALGCVLYEMATGRRAFEGKTRTSLIAAIVGSEPVPMAQLQPLTPPAFEHIVAKCLEKDREERWQSAHDIAEELRWVSTAGSQVGVAAPVVNRRRNRIRLLAAVAALSTVLAVLFGVLAWKRGAVRARQITASILPPHGVDFQLDRIHSAGLTISPDGSAITFVAKNPQGVSMLWIRSLERDDARPIAGTEHAQTPFWSPDGKSIGFFADAKLKRVGIGGGSPVALADASDGRGGTWSREGVILFAPTWRTGLSRVSENGGAVTQVTTPDVARGETTHRWPTFLPDGRHFLFLAANHRGAKNSEANAIYIGSLDSPERKLLVRARSNAIYSAGHVLFSVGNDLIAQPLDLGKLATSGEPRKIASNVSYLSGFFCAAFTAASDGTLVYVPDVPQPPMQVHWLDRTGHVVADAGASLGTLDSDIPQSLTLSPDDGRVACTIGDTSDIWIIDLARGTQTRFTSDAMNDFAPVWSPDGRQIIFASDRNVISEVYLKDVGGLSGERLVARTPDRMLTPASWSSDGKSVALEVADPKDPEHLRDIWILSTDSWKAVPFVETPFTETGGIFSPDQRWLTFLSNESGRFELYAAAFPARNEKRQLTSSGVLGYIWSRKGDEIVFESESNEFYSIAVGGGGFAAPRLMFKADGDVVAADLSRDGSRMLVAVAPKRPMTPLTLVSDWRRSSAQ